MYNNIIDQPEKCYGCGACVSVCPKDCLKIVKDELGFKKIQISEDECISCGACSRVCEALHMNYGEHNNLKRYYAQNKSREVLMRSSSGGVFTALAEYVFKHKGYVWGVQMDEVGKNQFRCVSNSEELKKLCGSKYVEVDSQIPFREVKEQVLSGAMVLFSGTPCQVQALNNFLNNIKYDNLLLVDLLCYGVQSPVIWEKYLSEININQLNLENVQMRYKKPGWEEYSMKVTFENGNIYQKSRWKDPYLLSYATNLYNREVCMQCKAKSFPRISDITLGDFWQIDTLEKIEKEIAVDLGVSIVLIHNSKGEKVFKQLDKSLYMFPLPNDVFTNMIERFSGCSKENINKEKFFQQLQNNSFQTAVKNNIDSQTYGRLRFKWLKIKRLIKRIKNNSF